VLQAPEYAHLTQDALSVLRVAEDVGDALQGNLQGQLLLLATAQLPIEDQLPPHLPLGGVIHCQAHAREAAEAQHAHQRVAGSNLRGRSHVTEQEGKMHAGCALPHLPCLTIDIVHSSLVFAGLYLVCRICHPVSAS
jgi:hypothetical protein